MTDQLSDEDRTAMIARLDQIRARCRDIATSAEAIGSRTAGDQKTFFRVRAMRARMATTRRDEETDRLSEVQESLLGQAETEGEVGCEVAPEQVEFCSNKRGSNGNRTRRCRIDRPVPANLLLPSKGSWEVGPSNQASWDPDFSTRGGTNSGLGAKPNGTVT